MGDKTNTVSKDTAPQKPEGAANMTTCNGCRGEINIYSYRTYYTKKGIYCKCCVEKLTEED